ncbi:hypothetical protein [Streptomyces sp. NPDC056937]|uniref:hypothetical protein n=1 Tax=Streptomyces sp. NPDC056937 TaxID=3345969 RepID=UPI003642B806
MSLIYQSVAALGAAACIGSGLAVYSHVHIDDVTRLFSLALAKGRAGGLYHAVAGETPNRWIAEKVAEDLGVKTRSVTPEEAEQIWGPFGTLILAASSRIRATAAQRELGWQPGHPDMLTMIGDQRLRGLVTPAA